MGNFGARIGLPSDGANAVEPRKRTPGSIIQSDGTISWDVTVVRRRRYPAASRLA